MQHTARDSPVKTSQSIPASPVECSCSITYSWPLWAYTAC